MDFRTLVNVKPFAKKMTYDSKAVSLGSCFSTEMGNRLLDRKYDVLLNPLGIAFNPMSIAMQIEKSLDLDFFK
ncbi:MAG: GSCFA domain-containing protein, partial [Paludibacteraceae bacterium]|nr:GSCFA domain-containing protein [Paludibacteraceae bacterium]